MTLRSYTVKWWSSVDWDWQSVELLTYDEGQVRKWVDAQTEPEYRLKRNLITGVESETLTIVYDGLVEIPYVTIRHS